MNVRICLPTKGEGQCVTSTSNAGVREVTEGNCIPSYLTTYRGYVSIVGKQMSWRQTTGDHRTVGERERENDRAASITRNSEGRRGASGASFLSETREPQRVLRGSAGTLCVFYTCLHNSRRLRARARANEPTVYEIGRGWTRRWGRRLWYMRDGSVAVLSVGRYWIY